MKMKAIDNEKDLEKRQEELAQEQLKKEKDLIEVMSTEAGRRFVWKLLEKTGMFRSQFIEKSLMLYWLCGRRDLGLEIFNDLTTVCPELFWKMQAENVQKPQTDEVENG